MNIIIKKIETYRVRYIVTVGGPEDRELTWEIIQIDPGLWRSHNMSNGWKTIAWPDTDLRLQLRWVTSTLREDVQNRRRRRKDERRGR